MRSDIIINRIIFFLFIFRYDAVSDQCRIRGIQGVPLTPWELRQEVCCALRYLPNRFKWVDMLFNGSFDSYSQHIANHSQQNEWTDDEGIIVAATALYLGENFDF